MLNDLGITTMRLMTNNPAKYGGLGGAGWRSPSGCRSCRPRTRNIGYLRTKREKMGHLLENLDD